MINTTEADFVTHLQCRFRDAAGLWMGPAGFMQDLIRHWPAIHHVRTALESQQKPLFNLDRRHRLHHETSRDCLLHLSLVVLLTLLPVAGRSDTDTTVTGGRGLLLEEIAPRTALIGHHTSAMAIGAVRLQKPEQIRRHSPKVGTYSRIRCAENLLVVPRR